MDNLKNVRIEFGLTQAVLADLLGISRSALNMTEQGKRKLPYDAKIRLAKLSLKMNPSIAIIPKNNPAHLALTKTGSKPLADKIRAAITTYSYRCNRLVIQRDTLIAARDFAQKTGEIIQMENRSSSKSKVFTSQLEKHSKKIDAAERKSDPLKIAEIEWKLNELKAMIAAAEEELKRLSGR